MVNKTLLKSETKVPNHIQKAYDLFQPYLPPNTKLSIEETDGKLCAKYLVRLQYTSHRSGRKMHIMAKGDNLPTKDDSTLRFYVLQIVLPPAEVGREFSRLYFLEKRAKQDAWLAMGKNSRNGDNSGDMFTIGDEIANKEKLMFEDYA